MHKPDYKKHPDGILDYIFDFANSRNGGNELDWLEAGETITTAVVTTTTTNLVIENSAIISTNSRVKVWISGGVSGDSYVIECKITTNTVVPTTSKFKFTAG